jgi:hypothetical protein
MVVPRVPIEKRAQAGIGALIDGIKFLRAHPIILAVLSLDYFATFFGSPRALLPVYASQIMGHPTRCATSLSKLLAEEEERDL